MTLLSFVCFVLYEDGAVTVSIAFTVLSIITMLKGPLGSLSAQRLIYVQAAVSLERIEAFLAEKEVYAPDGTNSSSSVVLNAHRLVVESATVEWPVLDRPAMTLRESDLQIPFRLAADAEFPPEKFSLIIGDTGSGKS
jgi:ABC-type multidrug transport system fused ATPase/permease subunit